MLLITKAGDFNCSRAEQRSDGLYLFYKSEDEMPKTILRNIEVIEVQGGEIVVIDPVPVTDAERLAELEEALELLLSGVTE